MYSEEETCLKINSYRNVVPGRIVVDCATRDNGGEAHLLFLVNGNEVGFLTVHDRYAAGLAPMFCGPHPKSIERFRKKIAQSIFWATPKEMYEYLRDEKVLWENHPMWERNRMTCVGFLSDVGYFLREECNIFS
jgi:hypothetical protein